MAGSFIAAFGPIIIVGCFGFCFYQWYQGYKRRKKRRFDYEPVQAVPRVVNAAPIIPVVKGRIIPRAQAIDEDVKLRQFFRDSGKYFPASKLDLLHLDLVASLFKYNDMPISQVYYSGGVYVIAQGNAYSLDSMFKSEVTVVDNIFANPFKITKQSSAIYDLKVILQIYDLYKKLNITG